MALHNPLENTLFVKRVDASLGKYQNVPILIWAETDGANLGLFAHNVDIIVAEVADIAAYRRPVALDSYRERKLLTRGAVCLRKRHMHVVAMEGCAR